MTGMLAQGSSSVVLVLFCSSDHPIASFADVVWLFDLLFSFAVFLLAVLPFS
jgi:hypothetical protein